MKYRTLHLTKRNHEYFYRYDAGFENEIIDELIRQANDTESDLDWIDVANLSHQLTEITADFCRKACGINCPPDPE